MEDTDSFSTHTLCVISAHEHHCPTFRVIYELSFLWVLQLEVAEGQAPAMGPDGEVSQK